MPIKPPKGVLAPGHFHHLCYLPCSALERGLDPNEQPPFSAIARLVEAEARDGDADTAVTFLDGLGGRGLLSEDDCEQL